MVPLDIYLKTGLGSEWIQQHLQQPSTSTTTPTSPKIHPSIAALPPIHKKVSEHSFIHYPFKTFSFIN
jgi:hypothetical protein